MKRADRLSREVVEAGFTIVSGLAAGIDTAAHRASLATKKGHTIGVIGTPLNEVYPKENLDLQECVAADHLLISQVPFYRYAHQPFKTKSYYFPERNETMAALSEATIIVEASDTSGSLTQARAALQQGRKLFILNSCFENRPITWPTTFAARGRSASEPLRTSSQHLAVIMVPLMWKRLEIDLIENPPARILASDVCYYAREYTAQKGYNHSQTNNLISNFKKPVSQRNSSQWKYKEQAIAKFSSELAPLLQAVNGRFILAAIPSSKRRDHAEYDNRLEAVIDTV